MKPNRRYQLRAYQDVDPVRTAAIIAALTPGHAGDVVTRAGIAEEWARRYPRHAGLTGRRSIRRRIGIGLSLLRLAGAVKTDGQWVTVGAEDRLQVIAANRDAIETADGDGIPPGRWSTRPTVPDHLQAVQDDLVARFTQPTVHDNPLGATESVT